MTEHEIAPEILQSVLKYDPETGRLFWLRRADARECWNTRYAGKEAFTSLTSDGYRQGGIFGKVYLAHRVIWTLETGAWPAEFLDHIDGCKANNRLSNLREATCGQNCRNRKSHRGSSSKYLGVSWNKVREKWQAFIRTDGKQKFLGLFEYEKEAALAYDRAARTHFGAFANPNFTGGSGSPIPQIDVK